MASTLQTHAEALRDNITDQSYGQLAGTTVLVEQEKELQNQVNIALGKTGGACVVIQHAGGEIVDVDSETPEFTSIVRLMVFNHPVIRDGMATAIEKVETLMFHCHHLVVDSDAIFSSHYHCWQYEVVRYVRVDDPSFEVYQIDLRTRFKLTTVPTLGLGTEDGEGIGTEDDDFIGVEG